MLMGASLIGWRFHVFKYSLSVYLNLSFVDPASVTATTPSLAVSSRMLTPESARGSTKLSTQQDFRGSGEEIS